MAIDSSYTPGSGHAMPPSDLLRIAVGAGSARDCQMNRDLAIADAAKRVLAEGLIDPYAGNQDIPA